MQLGSSLRRRRGDDRPRPEVDDASAGGAGPGLRARFERLDPRARLLLVAAAVVVVGWGVGYLGATRVLFPAPAPPGAMVEVPDVRGLALDEARQRMLDRELDPADLEGVQHPRADSGQVVAQAPLPGQFARPGAAVRLTVSLGAERREVPAVVGLRADRAVDMLQAMGLSVRADSVEASAPRGRIVSVTPDEGSAITLPGAVRVVVSLGPPSVAMPSVLGMDEDEARERLEELGLEVGEVDEVFRFGRDQGRVVSQEPAEGVELERGATVRLVVGRRGG